MQVNWEAKSDNILRVARELNVGLESLIFIDDNPFELEQVKAALPDVDVYHFEAGRADRALGLLASIPGLKGWSITAEDRKKAEQYRDERKRTQLKQSATSLEDYLRSLDIKLKIGRNRKSQIQRIAQLTNKTNQFNLTTRRYSEADIARFMQTGTVLDVALSDRFGDMGVISVAIVLDNEIDTFLMSCRALGRGVEARILSYICERFGSPGMQAAYVPTAKNMMTAQFYDAHGFELVADEGPKGKRYRLAGDCAPGPVEIPIEEVEGGA
jgi:FkbH-like protein